MRRLTPFAGRHAVKPGWRLASFSPAAAHSVCLTVGGMVTLSATDVQPNPLEPLAVKHGMARVDTVGTSWLSEYPFTPIPYFALGYKYAPGTVAKVPG